MNTSETGKKVSRRKARKTAFEVLYGLEFEPVTEEKALYRSFEVSPDPEEGDGEVNAGFAWELTRGVWKNSRELDKTIQKFSKNWKISRIAKVELTILRLAVFEILHQPDIPLKVALNEAIELAKAYGDDNSPGFINGVLDAMAKAVDKGEFDTKKAL